jgi:dienelactone hydrolase
MRVQSAATLAGLVLFTAVSRAQEVGMEVLPGTQPLEMQGDLAAAMVAGIQGFLLEQTAAAVEGRAAYWHREASSPAAYAESVRPNRERLRTIVGAVDARPESVAMELVATTDRPALLAECEAYAVYTVRWEALEGVHGEGLLLRPQAPPVARVIALPDCDWTPEMLVGLAPGIEPRAQFARRLAESGCEVLVPLLLNRDDTFSGSPAVRYTNQPHREFVYRMAFEVGRHIIGYEVQKVLAAVDWCAAQGDQPVGVIGYGEGGLLSFYAAACDERIDAACVSGYFQPRENLYQEPIYRNVFGLLEQFGEAEIASLVAPRALIIEACSHPEVEGPPAPREGRNGAAPGRLTTPPFAEVQREFERARGLWPKGPDFGTAPVLVGDGDGPPGSDAALQACLEALTGKAGKPASGSPPAPSGGLDADARTQRQLAELCEHTQEVLRQSSKTRDSHWRACDKSSPERWRETTQANREWFWEDVIGRLPAATLPPNARTRLAYDEPKWRGYEVVLDVWPSGAGFQPAAVIAYGILLLPKDLQPGERRPVVVCQHGLEGRPQDTIAPPDNPYSAFSVSLAERGFVVYAPQNPYTGMDDFRVLQRLANPLKKTLFSVIVRQHEQTLKWLAEQPFVDPERMAFYGISYGGKTAMRVPAMLEQYCLSICSADFNEWVLKNASYDDTFSYVYTGEYEIFEWDLAHTFNYAEMAYLIAPRPFMVERGHSDGVGIDEWVAFEYAKVRRLYAELGIRDQTEIEFLTGGHMIFGQGTFDFLHRHLGWPQ